MLTLFQWNAIFAMSSGEGVADPATQIIGVKEQTDLFHFMLRAFVRFALTSLPPADCSPSFYAFSYHHQHYHAIQRASIKRAARRNAYG
jgi:hypothetical protein